MARAETAWRCSQCGTVNEAGSRKCAGCGKWPSLFDLQNAVDAAPEDEFEALELEIFEPETFEAETFQPEETFETETFEPVPFETGLPQREPVQPVEEAEGGSTEEEEGKSRFPRWAITAIWVVGLVIWVIVNAVADNG